MAEKLCTVTAIEPDGRRYSLQVRATSTYRAAFSYNSEAVTNPSHGLPRPEMDTLYEVQVEGDERVYRFSHRKAMEWANRQPAGKFGGH